MATKTELEEKLNDRLNTEMEWSSMKKRDLQQVVDMLESGKLLEKVGKGTTKEVGGDMFEDKVDDWSPGSIYNKVKNL